MGKGDPPPVLHQEEDPTSYPQKDSVRSHRSSLSTPGQRSVPTRGYTYHPTQRMREGECNPLRGTLSIAREIDLPGPSPMLTPRQLYDSSPFFRSRCCPFGTKGEMLAEEFVGKVLDLLHHEGDPMERIRTKMA